MQNAEQLKYAYLDLSTGHVSQTTMQFIEAVQEENCLPMTIANYEYGAFITVPSDFDDLPKGLPKDLKEVLEYANKQGCILVRLDKDADTTTDLPIYYW